MPRKGHLTRKITVRECPWLGADLPKGKKVYEYNGHTYGCIRSGIAVSDKPDETPAYEVPESAVCWE